MKILCPDCRSEILLSDVNVATDIALCRRCSKPFSYAELADVESEELINLAHPPQGCWFEENGRGFEAGASTRHPMALFLVVFMCIWSGFTLGGIYGSQIQKGEFDLGMSLFGIPFLVGTLFLGSLALILTCGKTFVRVENDQGVVFMGVGAIGWRRKFKWSAVRGIKLTARFTDSVSLNEITIHADRRIAFASGLNSTRLNFLLGALRKLHGEKQRFQRDFQKASATEQS